MARSRNSSSSSGGRSVLGAEEAAAALLPSFLSSLLVGGYGSMGELEREGQWRTDDG